MDKKKLLGFAGILIIIAAIFFIKSRIVFKPQNKEISSFLSELDYAVHGDSVDSLAQYFDGAKNTPQLHVLLGVLVNKTRLNGEGKPLFKTDLLVSAADVSPVNTELTKISIPVRFDEGTNTIQQTTLVFLVRKNQNGHIRVVKVDSKSFIEAYTNYQRVVKDKKGIDETHYSDITLKAFADAQKLKGKYDTIVWLGHVDKQTYFYVANGKWDTEEGGMPDYVDSLKKPKMGLVNPALKEIVPADYDLIYTINGSVKGLVEVEKDKKRGFYNLSGKNVLPVNYDQIFPLIGDDNLAVLRNGDDYFYLKKDTTVSEKINIKVNDFFSKIKGVQSSYAVNTSFVPSVIELNSRGSSDAIYISPSYLVDLDLMSETQFYKNPFRSDPDNDIIDRNFDYKLSMDKGDKSNNLFEAFFYSIKNYFVGGREGFYDKKNIVIVDKKHGRVFSHSIHGAERDESSGLLKGLCDVNSIKTINDSLIEVKVGEKIFFDLYNSPVRITGGPVYQYLAIRNNKLVELPANGRYFAFTKYVKMDDSYLNACYMVTDTTDNYKNKHERPIDQVSADMLRYMKNEIYAGYQYKFKDPKWNRIFYEREVEYDDHYGPKNANVTDSLTTIDKYNINFIDQRMKKMNGAKTTKPVLAATK
jgi:hypothetical protein